MSFWTWPGRPHQTVRIHPSLVTVLPGHSSIT